MGKGHEARGKTFLLITPSLWPRDSRLNIGDCSRSAALKMPTEIFEKLIHVSNCPCAAVPHETGPFSWCRVSASRS